MSLKPAAKVYNVPVETTQQRVLGKVAVDCKPDPADPATVFSRQELVGYVVQMANMGFGLTRGDLQLTEYHIAERVSPLSNSWEGMIGGIFSSLS